MSKFEQLTTFIQVVEQQGIHRAAEKLHLSAAAVTKQIQALEASLGTVLFDRAKRRLQLTSLGMRYYQAAVGALKNLQQLEALIQTDKQEVAGVLRVRTTHHHAHTMILPILKPFLEQYPKLQLKLEIHEFLPDFQKEAVDIVVGASLPGKPDWIQKKIGSTRYVLCATPEYLKQYGTPKTIADLSAHRYLTHMGRNPDCVIRFKDQELVVAPYLWVNNYAGLFGAALQHLGMIWVHEDPAKPYLESGELREVLAQHSLRDQAVYLYYPQETYIDPKVRALVDFLETPASS